MSGLKKPVKYIILIQIDHPIKVNDYVIVETARGIDYGKAVTEKKQVSENDVVLPLKKVVRVADEKDKESVEANKKAAMEAFHICNKKIEEHSLDMKLVDV